ncbi:MAG: hypothetical protein GX113_07000 [Actinobacteria bacterium]|jgi:serine/threonine protein kinase|nr:hypothetical protein [Actinomycetota bacterium]
MSQSIDATANDLWARVCSQHLPAGCDLIHRSLDDIEQRIYGCDEQIFKVRLRGERAWSLLRQQDLRGEYNILRMCESIRGVPRALSFNAYDACEVSAYSRLPGIRLDESELRLFESAHVAVGLFRILLRLSFRGIAHNDVKPNNILRADHSIALVDFDQAVRTSRFSALCMNLFGIRRGAVVVHGSFWSVLTRHLLRKHIPRRS